MVEVTVDFERGVSRSYTCATCWKSIHYHDCRRALRSKRFSSWRQPPGLEQVYCFTTLIQSSMVRGISDLAPVPSLLLGSH
jgi:hypothetical protein